MTEGESLRVQIQHRLVEELAEKERRHRALLEGLRCPVVELCCGHISYLNRAWTEELGYPVETSLLRPLGDFLVGPHRAVVAPEACEAIQDRADFEVRFRHQDGGERWYELSLTRAEPGKLLGMLYNIDDRRRAADLAREQAAQLRRTNAALELASRQRNTFLACMSHELRTPLNAVLGFAELLAEQTGGALTDDQLRYVSRIAESGRHLLDLINDILDISRLADGGDTIINSVVTLAKVVDEALRMVQPEADRKRITVTLENLAITDTAVIDPRRLKQILVNLLANAVKFTDSHGQVSLQVTRENETVHFRVRDTGIGIAPADLPKLFRPFTQLDNGLNRSQGGTGLGLHLVRRTSELLGGDITVISEPGKGSLFTCSLPLPPVRHQSAPTVPAAAGHDEPGHDEPGHDEPGHDEPGRDEPGRDEPGRDEPGRDVADTDPLHVLLVEDDAANQELIAHYLNATGTRVSVASDGRQACELAAKLLPSVILMDIQMPHMDGIQATSHIASNPATQHIPIVALTALAMKGDRERCLAAGATTYLSKPVNLVQLSQLLADINLKQS
jgi:PAS domain S-box-containing protein